LNGTKLKWVYITPSSENDKHSWAVEQQAELLLDELFYNAPLQSTSNIREAVRMLQTQRSKNGNGFLQRKNLGIWELQLKQITQRTTLQVREQSRESKNRHLRVKELYVHAPFI